MASHRNQLQTAPYKYSNPDLHRSGLFIFGYFFGISPDFVVMITTPLRAFFPYKPAARLPSSLCMEVTSVWRNALNCAAVAPFPFTMYIGDPLPLARSQAGAALPTTER